MSIGSVCNGKWVRMERTANGNWQWELNGNEIDTIGIGNAD